MSQRPSVLKLKVSNPQPPKQEPQDSPPPPTPSSTGTKKLTIKFGGKSKSQTPAPAPGSSTATSTSIPAPTKAKPGRKPKPTPKKRALEEDPEANSSSDEPSISAPGPAVKRLKLTTHGPVPSPTSVVPTKIFIKNQKPRGKAPKRPKGVGYDSEGEREDDPTISESVILRMAPGPDCEYLRAAIASGNFGKTKEGGADVRFRFLRSDGRRACVSVRGNHYAAILVDLPCIIEGMKSWFPKQGWMKSVDICQMLLVLGNIRSVEEAANYPIPSSMLEKKELDEKTWQYAHGLTPPMHWVRKRRFRKRISVRTVMEVEAEVEELLRKDDECEGEPEIEIIEKRQVEGSSDGSDDEDPYGDQDADGDLDYPDQFQAQTPLETIEGEEDEETRNARIAEDFERQMMAGEDFDTIAPTDTLTSAGPSFDSPTTTLPTTAQETLSTPPSLAGTPASLTANTPTGAADTSSAAEGSDTSSNDSDSADEETQEQQQETQRQKEEIADLEAAIKGEQAKLAGTGNALLKRRLVEKIASLRGDLDVRVAALGGAGG